MTKLVELSDEEVETLVTLLGAAEESFNSVALEYPGNPLTRVIEGYAVQSKDLREEIVKRFNINHPLKGK